MAHGVTNMDDDWVLIDGIACIREFSGDITDLFVDGEMLMVVTEHGITAIPIEELE